MQGIDVFALLLGLFLLFIIFFALLGVYARRVSGKAYGTDEGKTANFM